MSMLKKQPRFWYFKMVAYCHSMKNGQLVLIVYKLSMGFSMSDCFSCCSYMSVYTKWTGQLGYCIIK